MQRKLVSHDPQRNAILARIRAVWRHLPRNGVLIFFDIKPIAVKAYGGRRYTSAKRLVLERYQKTRGFFYLFALYDVKQGRVRWAFYLSKDSQCVCRFMQRIRNWYPNQEVWVILDQDRAHPRKSRETRRIMRALKLHWISLPKASPDDNTVEVGYSYCSSNEVGYKVTGPVGVESSWFCRSSWISGAATATCHSQC